MILSAATPIALLAILHVVDNDNVPACLADNFYGIFGQQSLFKLADVACLDLVPASSGGGSFVPLYSHQQQLVWIQESSVDDSLRTPEYEYEVAQFLGQFHAHEPISSGPQATLFDHSASLIHRSDHFVILAVSDERAADALSAYLPRFWKAAPIPASPVSFLPVPETAVQHVRDLLASLRFDPFVAGIVGRISVDQLRKDIRFLTNEDGESGIVSRHSFHDGSRVAARWIKQQFEETGATCRFMEFMEGFAPNVIW